MRPTRDFLIVPNVIVHAFNRGVNRGQLFHCDRECDRFMEILIELQKKIPVSLLIHSLMKNHFHLVLQQLEPFAISRFMQRVSQSYAQWLNRRSNRSGHVFQGRYGSVVVADAEGFLSLSRYVHTNPVQARFVPRPEQWRYSSCKGYLTRSDEIPDNRELLWSLVGGPEGYARFLREYDPADPDSVRRFLVPGAARLWSTACKPRRRKISR